MTNFLDATLLARLQFAFTVSFHIVFPAFTIGLASWLAVVEWRWLKTHNVLYKETYLMWVKIFAVCFGMGVVSGVVMSYQFGTNWSHFSDKTGNVLGPLIGYEVLTAFFLEASFLGIMLFGWNRVSEKMHFASTCIVASGTLLSAFWILSANSWMQTPAGFSVGADGLLLPENWLSLIFNPSFPYRFVHMVTGAYLTTAFVVGGIGAYYLYNNRHVEHAKIMFGMAMLMATFVAPLQLLFGHMHGDDTMIHQPVKVAAMEGNWERGAHKPLLLFALPSNEAEKNLFQIGIPGGASWVLTFSTAGEIPGLKDVPKEDRPPVWPVFFSFRVMVGLGILMILTGIAAAVLYKTGRLFSCKKFHLWCTLMTPSGFVAVLAGWFVTEIGRQPYLAYHVLRTGENISPVIAEQVLITLITFVVVYTLIFGAGSYYILKLIGKGPKKLQDQDTDNLYDHSRMHSVAKAALEGVD